MEALPDRLAEVRILPGAAPLFRRCGRLPSTHSAKRGVAALRRIPTLTCRGGEYFRAVEPPVSVRDAGGIRQRTYLTTGPD